jgi:hypothetical protein
MGLTAGNDVLLFFYDQRGKVSAVNFNGTILLTTLINVADSIGVKRTALLTNVIKHAGTIFCCVNTGANANKMVRNELKNLYPA